MAENKKKNKKQRCPNCNGVMKQQFIGLKHCKCGTSWQSGVGYFERTSDMVFALDRKVVKKSKNSVKTKQVPVIRYKNQPEQDTGAICNTCKGNMLKVDGCRPYAFLHNGNKYNRFKVGDEGDFFEDCEPDMRCGDCNAKYGHYHHDGCDCEHCPVCGGQLLTCGCDLHMISGDKAVENAERNTENNGLKMTQNRRSRLEKAKKWLPTYNGTKIVRAYRKKFHVDVVCAVRELQEIGYEFKPGYVENLLKAEAGRVESLKRQKEQKRLSEEYNDWQDDRFYFIAGYTSGGAPYGVTWEQMGLEPYEDDNE